MCNKIKGDFMKKVIDAGIDLSDLSVIGFNREFIKNG